MIVPRYYEDLQVLHLNTEENRAYFVPASRGTDCSCGERGRSDRFMLLSGAWRFRYFESIYDVEEHFWEEGAPLVGFGETRVPGTWQNEGYDRHQYTNTRYPFPMDPPYVPQENPCGAYVRSFLYRRDPAAPRAFLNFEGVDSCFYLWVNGTFVGYSQVSHSTSEFEVTDLLRDGENTAAVLVLKWCDGSYMEDQDKFRMSGIFRDVYLLARPAEGIRDYFVKAYPVNGYRDGRVEIDVSWLGRPAAVKVELRDRDGVCVARAEQKDQGAACAAEGERPDGDAAEKADGAADRLVLPVPDAHLWNAEEPYLYTLVLTTEGEVITDHVGIREIHTEGGVLFLNGVKVKFHGVNRHDSDPVTGFAISREQLLRDLLLMKRHNVNAIRTSHYPNAPWAYELYDRLGFYVIDEADHESHGTQDIYMRGDWGTRAERWNVPLADNPAYTPATLDRTRRLVERDKNRPCVVIWSMGNECAYGCTFEEALRWTKGRDATRLTHFESARYTSKARKYDYSSLDTYSRMYPPLSEIHEYFEKDGSKPFLMCEFCHAMGNGPGDLEDYFAVIHQYDGACGGFVWEWCDHAIDMGRTAEGRKRYAYGGDHGEYPHDGNFCMDGLVYPDRRVHTGLKEFANVYRPARAAGPDAGAVMLRNYLDFTNLKDVLTLRWEVTCDGWTVEAGDVTEEARLDIGPGCTGRVEIPFHLPERGKCFLKLTYLQKTASEALPAGHVLGFDELPLATEDNRNQTAKELLAGEEQAAEPVKIREDDRGITLAGGDFRYRYDKLTGSFSELVYRNHSLLAHPMQYNLWRAPTDNDRNIKHEWMEAQYDRTIARAYETSVSAGEDGGVSIETVLSVSAVYIQRILNIRARWTVSPSGVIDAELDVKKDPEFPFLPRFGLRLFLPKKMARVTYCGLGPQESYVDKRRAASYGVYEADAAALHEDYLRPQENGSHYGCDYVTVSGGEAALTAVSAEPFSFNASPYTQEELTRKNHNYELEEADSTVFCVDYRQSGIGSNSCGPELLEQYRLNPEEFVFRVRLLPDLPFSPVCATMGSVRLKKGAYDR